MYREHFGKRNKLRFDDDIAHLDDAAFEELVAAHFTRQGYRVERAAAGDATEGEDARIDMMIYQGRDAIAVRCKHNRLYQVTQKPIQTLAALAREAGANSAMLVASGEFTRQARAEAASATRLLLIDGTDLRRMLAPPQAPKAAPVAATTGESPATPIAPAYADADPFLPSSVRRWRKIGPPLAAGVIVMTTVLVLVALNEHKERPLPPPPPPPPPSEPVISEAERQRQIALAAEQLRRAQAAARARREAYDAAMAEQQAKEAELEQAEREHQQKVLESIPEMDLYPSGPITQEEKPAKKKR